MSNSNSQYSDHPWSNVASKLHLAKKKLAPVIKNLMESASGDSDHPARPSMTVDEYSDAVWAAGILAEVEESLEKSKRKRYMKQPRNLNTKFDFPTKGIKVNESGKVNIDTSVLVQLIELHQSLGTIINNINEERCDADNQVIKKEKKKNNIILKVIDQPDEMQSLDTEDDRICNKLGKQIVVMAANVVTDKNPEEADTRKTKSTGSLYDRLSKSSNVDSAGAKKIIINCIADLDKVKEFLESDPERSGPASQKSVQKSQKSNSNSSQRGESSEEPQTATESGEGSSSAQEILLEESDLNSSKIVICIKGQNEEDLQIVIRQCPECKQNNIEPAPRQYPSKMLYEQPSSKFSKTEIPLEGEQEMSNHRIFPTLTKMPSEQPSIKFSKTEILPEGQESANFDSDYSEKSKLSVLFNTEDPPKSIVDCIPINMYDAHRFCVTTATGEELLLTLTVAPKNAGSPVGPPPPQRNRSTQMRQPSSGQLRSSPPVEAAGDQSFILKDVFSDATVKGMPSTDQMPSTQFGSTDDLLIPLYRTKVCSSLQLDVERAPSRMRTEGISHEDESISSYFNKLGVDKLLRACRPVKCARKAILNEPSKKCLPYSPSLKSLPLDETDLHIIKQSLEMSITRSRASTSFIKKPVLSKPDRCSVRFQINEALVASNVSTAKKKSTSVMYIKRPSGDDSVTSQYNIRQVYYFHVFVPREAKEYLIKKKLEYYIYLNSDQDRTRDPLVEMFDVRSRKMPKADKTTNSSLIGSVFHDKIEKKQLRLLPAVTDRQNVFTMKDIKTERLKQKRKKLPSRIPIYKYRRKVRSVTPLQTSKKNVRSDDNPVACRVGVSTVGKPVQITKQGAEKKSGDIYKFKNKLRRQPTIKCSASKSLSNLEAKVEKSAKFGLRSVEKNNVAEASGPGIGETSESKIIVNGISSILYDAFIKKLSGTAKAEISKIVKLNCTKRNKNCNI